MNGADAFFALRHHAWKVFYPANNGREGLFLNLQSLSIEIFGPSPFALRIVAALAVVASVAGLYFLVRDLYDDRIALLAAFVHACLLWSIIISRMGFRANLGSAILVWFLWALLRAVGLTERDSQRSRIPIAVIAGIAFGLGFQTYIAFRIVPIIALVIVLLAWRKRVLELRPVLVAALTSFVVSLPLLLYFAANPGSFTGRAAQVSLMNTGTPVQHFLWNCIKELGMFFIHGDDNWHHNIGGLPMIDYPMMPFFAVGLVCVLFGLYRTLRNRALSLWREIVLLSWLAFGSLPGLLGLSYDFPHGLRLLMIVPAVCTVIALGFWRVLDYLVDRWERVQRLTPLLVLCFCASLLYRAYTLYFVTFARDPRMHVAYLYHESELATEALSSHPSLLRYILVPHPEVHEGIPVLAASFAYLTQTLTAREQDEKNIHYWLEPTEPDTSRYAVIRLLPKAK